MTIKRTRNWTYLTVAGIVRAYMLGALAISFGHIVTASEMLGLHGFEAYTVPFAIDGFAVLGMIGRSHRFAPATRRIGFRLQAGAGALSLVCNVYAGTSLGARLYGALIVVAFVVAESYAERLRPAPVVAPVVVDDAAVRAERRSAAARKAAATRAARKAEAATTAKPARKPRQRKPAAPKVPVYLADAPVSPAPNGQMVGGLWVPAGALR